jgi:hypothetical protein
MASGQPEKLRTALHVISKPHSSSWSHQSSNSIDLGSDSPTELLRITPPPSHNTGRNNSRRPAARKYPSFFWLASLSMWLQLA